jgi:N-acetylglutamate synthase-like GNAT family acetyltransferase
VHQLIVIEEAGVLLGCAQLTLLAGLSRGGARRALIEAVRVVDGLRGQGLGAGVMAECEVRACGGGGDPSIDHRQDPDARP